MTGEIYDLLPAHIKTRDEEAEGVLKALFALMQREGDVVEDDIRRLAETWFIETCPSWAIPYIGQLLDARALHDLGPESGFSPRAWVGNTIRNRQRKGTLGAIESVASEATGLPARANEMFERLSATQWLNHRRLHRNAAAHIRDGDAMALTGSAFDRTPRSAEVRRIDRNAGRYNIPNIAIHLWRLQPYRLPQVEAARISGYQFTVDPLGRDIPLYWRGETETDASGFAACPPSRSPFRMRQATHSSRSIPLPSPFATCTMSAAAIGADRRPLRTTRHPAVQPRRGLFWPASIRYEVASRCRREAPRMPCTPPISMPRRAIWAAAPMTAV